MAAADQTKRYEGTVKWFNGRKGFGFIAPADDTTTTGHDDLFVHQSEIKADGFRFLRDGEKVEFSVDIGEDGRKKAVDVVGFGRTRGYQPGVRRGRSRGGGYGRYRGGGGGGFGGELGDGDGHGGRGGRDGGGGSRVGTRPECYNCGRVGHFARDCYRGTGDHGGGYDQGYDNGRGGGRGGRSRACYRCGDEGHFARECPNDQD